MHEVIDLPDDMVVGFVIGKCTSYTVFCTSICIGMVLGYNVTDIKDMNSQYDDISFSNLQEMSNYVCVCCEVKMYSFSYFFFADYGQ